MSKSDFSVAVFPFLKTNAPVRLGRYTFRSTTDIDGLPSHQAAAVSEVASMLFLRDNLQIERASYAIAPPMGVFRPGPVVEDLARVRTVVAYLYSAPHPIFGDVFLTPDEISLLVLEPAKVSRYLVSEIYGAQSVDPISAQPTGAKDDLVGYEGVYNVHFPVWVTTGSRLYGPKPQMTLNISQDLSDLSREREFSRPDAGLLLGMLESSPTPLSERVFTALDWYNSANTQGDRNRALLNLGVAFETLLQLPASEKTERLVDAISLLLGRTERLQAWAGQFYSARSQAAHEGRVKDWWFYAGNDPKKGGERHPFGDLMTYGRHIFQLCVSTVLVGANLAERFGLRDRFISNSERYASISEALGRSAGEPAELLLQIRPFVDGLKQFQFVARGSVAPETMLHAVRLAAAVLLKTKHTLSEELVLALGAVAETNRKDGELQKLSALECLATAFKEKSSVESTSAVRVVSNLVDIAWSNLFMLFCNLKREADEAIYENNKPDDH